MRKFKHFDENNLKSGQNDKKDGCFKAYLAITTFTWFECLKTRFTSI